MSADLFSPERLRLARERRRLFAQELAGRIGVTPRSVHSWERGKAEPRDAQVQKLVEHLDFPKSFFYGDAPPRLDGAAFRSLLRTTARDREQARAAGAQAVWLDAWIDARFERPAPDLPDLSGFSPLDAAQAVRTAWGLGNSPLPNLVHLLEAHGVRVYALVHTGADIDALSAWHGAVPFVFFNTATSTERSRMNAAHELGHLVMHAHSDVDRTKVDETEAREFASTLLMPEQAFIASAPRQPSLAAILASKRAWGVSAMAYVYRMHRLGLLRPWHYQRLCIEIRSTYARTEPEPRLRAELSQVMAVVFNGSDANSSRLAASRDLSLPLADLDAITRGLALTAIVGGASADTRAATPPPTLRLLR